MGPRFIESKKRLIAGRILTGKSNRKVRQTLSHTKKPESLANTTNAVLVVSTTEDGVLPTPSKSHPVFIDTLDAAISGEKFIGGELLEYDDTLDAKRQQQQVNRPARSEPIAPLADPPRLSKIDAQNRCLAFDTRSLVIRNNGADDCTPATVQHHRSSISHDMNQFLQHLSIRGYTVPVVAWTISDSSKRSKMSSVDTGVESSGAIRQLSYRSGIGIQTTNLSSSRTELDPLRLLVNSTVPIESSSISSSSSLEQGKWKLSEIPNTLTADFTWNLMAKLVESIIEAAEGNTDGSKDVTILSSEVAFFTDIDIDAHIAGLDVFVKRLTHLFAHSHINSVEIALVSRTDCRLLHSQESSSNARDSCEKSMLSCIDQLRRKMEDLEYQHLSSSTTNTTLAIEKRIQVSIERIGSSDVGCKMLARRWVRECIGRHPHHRITLDLPETADGSQCAVALDIMYQVCPIRLTNPRIDDLLADLEVLVTSGLEVVQRIPLSSLDASLLFGVPFVLQAGLDSDYDRYRETQMIVISLLRLLEDREEALLLRLKQRPKHGSKAYAPAGLFVSNANKAGNNETKFVFMTKQAVRGSPSNSSTAIMFPLANDTDLLTDVGNGSAVMANTMSSLEEDIAIQYATFLESSLSCLVCSGYNPMITVPKARGVVSSSAVSTEPLPKSNPSD